MANVSQQVEAEKCASCSSCGFPLNSPEDHALGDERIPYCRSCTDAQGRLLPYERVLEVNVDYYVSTQGIDAAAARHMAAEVLARMPAWRGRPASA